MITQLNYLFLENVQRTARRAFPTSQETFRESVKLYYGNNLIYMISLWESDFRFGHVQ